MELSFELFLQYWNGVSWDLILNLQQKQNHSTSDLLAYSILPRPENNAD